MSRFFKGSDSESDSSDDSEEFTIQRPAVTTKVFQLSDDEEETRRVVRSEKDKRYEELLNIIKSLKNKKKIKDMSNVLSDFESLCKAFDKAKKVVEKEGIPRFYIRTLSELEEFVSECWEDREGRKKMNKTNAKSLTTLRQKLKKYSKDFEKELEEYKENPDDTEDELDAADGEASEESDEEEQAAANSFFQKEKPAKPVKTYDDDDSEGWTNSESDSESDEDAPDDYTNMAAYFLKDKTTDDKKEKKQKKLRSVKQQVVKDVDEGDDEGGWEEVTGKGGAPMVVEKPKMFAKDTEVNHEAVVKKLLEIIAARGKKGTDRQEQIELLKELYSIAEANNLGYAMSVKIGFNIIAAIYDYNPNIATCMRSEMWELCLKNVEMLLSQLKEHQDITVGANILEDSENLETAPFRVRGCILTVVERLCEEYTKMLQACDAHSTEYVERLRDDVKVCSIVDALLAYLDGRATSEEICRVYLRKVESVYYKMSGCSEAEMDKLCQYIYTKDSTDRLRTRAILCHIYHHALHDRWFQARDLMLMSHLQDTIQHSDVPTQILYNRTMVQLGLCSFRQGMTKDAHNALVDIQSGGRAKELLAQGLLLQRQHERTPEQEKIEKRRLLPYHMHINLELLECVYLVSAMLMEIPYMAAHEMDARRRMISKNFHHVLRMSERQTLTGPPESMREHIVAASKAMKTGDWKACKNFIINEKMNSKVWDLFQNKDAVRDMIVCKIQEESLRTYLFTYSSVYDTLSLVTLAEMFELDVYKVHSVISKMIINEELMASLDEPTQTVIMHRTEPTRLQALALQLSEKVGTLVENNERILEIKQGNFFFTKNPNQQNRDQSGGYQQNQQNWSKYKQQNQTGNRRPNRNQQQQRAY
ncbi:eukaryotic translation initiation factor 3 subunit C-like isoform X2 [Mercenaria mercenaria]|uniref:eukaryotic translation initiation factor 3 subunit C-like isoform X2 n=1 Tax=Mercenaria mercenaria TaxID=6596 RepID=UPI00234ECA1D|nr:eukaryotic translation initiation factor 3 subunit C-like isoform X2 [Mercenaria mercenaria]